MKNLKQRRKAAAFHNTQPTMTDQSQAASTDLNVIVNQFLRTGQSPNRGNPIYGDFTQLPQNLRDAFEHARSIKNLRRQLPPQLRELGPAELLALTPEDIKRILKPADKPADQSKETPA